MARVFFSAPSIESFAVPAVSILVSFLAYTSQYLFRCIEPGPLSRKEAIWFNGCVLGIWWCYALACSVDPGPKGWVNAVDTERNEKEDAQLKTTARWCKKCDAIKPPRAHHCKRCGRCIPKMDHHCPWTTNCVSHTNFPHFVRFLFYAVVSMSMLEYFLYERAIVIWDNRNMPAYYGPPVWGMAHLFVLIAVNSITLFALVVLLTTCVHSLAINTTMIEHWEIERHEAVVDRSRKLGGYVYANGGQRVRVEHQEYPYDIGIWKNLVQGFGTANVLLWFLPFGGGPNVDSALRFEVNGFEDEDKVWPPPDPEKMPRAVRPADALGQTGLEEYDTPEDELAAFKRRQEKDFQRRDWGNGLRYDEKHYDSDDDLWDSNGNVKGEWTSASGDRLADFGVDEDAELDDEDDIPLGELIRRRKNKNV